MSGREDERRAARRPLPRRIPADGLLIGWSMEERYRSLPFGFAPSRPQGGVARTCQPLLHTGGGHLMTIAPTGAGKGVGAIIPALLRHRGPVIVVDPKGENYAVTARRRREMGQEVVVLDPFGVTGEATGGFNPLDLLVEGDSQVEDAAMLAELLTPSAASFESDPFWNTRARQVVSLLLLLIARRRPPVLRHLGELDYLLHQSPDDLAGTVGELRLSPDAVLREQASVLEAVDDGRVLSGYLSVAQDHVSGFDGPELAAAIARSSFDVDAITRGDPVSVYLVFPPDRMRGYRNLLRAWIGGLFALVLRRRRRVQPETLFLLDEAAQLGPLDQLRQAVTLLRGYGLQTWSFWQDLSQLQRLYPRDWSTMVNNCAVHQVFGITTMRLARSVAGLNRTHDARALLELEPDEMELALAGALPVLARRPDYRSDPVFSGQFDANPRFEPAAPPAPDHPTRCYDASTHRLHPSHEEINREIEEAWTLGDFVEDGWEEIRCALPPEYWLRVGPDGEPEIVEAGPGGPPA